MQGTALPLLHFGATAPTEQACRLRRGGHTYRCIPPGYPADTATKKNVTTRDNISYNSFVPGACFVICMLSFVVTGLLCIAFPPEATDTFDEHVIPDTAKCLRISRHANYVSVDIVIGTSASLLNLLLRMDMVKGSNETAMRLFSNRVAESDSVSCQDTLCTDFMLLHTEGPSSPQKQAVVRFKYTNPTTEAMTYGTAVTIHMDGEFALKQGYDYFLTTTHLCWADATADLHSSAQPDARDNEGAVPARVDNGFLKADAAGLEQTVTMRNTPAGHAQIAGTCSSGIIGEVALFPGAAADEAQWLGLSSDRMYESSPDNVDDRRVVVEVGKDCAANDSSFARAYSLYQLDCRSIYVPCNRLPSVPFRRVASDQLRVHLPDDGSNMAYVFTAPDVRLEALPKLDDGVHAMWLSLIKLGLMTLAAAVVWIRAGKGTASLDRLFMHCLRMAHYPSIALETLKDKVESTIVWEDGIVGFVAIAARFATAIWRMFSLSVDGQLRAPTAQLIASVLSLVQWTLRYFVLQSEREAPLTKLGGSTALIDATTAVMLGFAEPPLFVSSINRFDPTARLLTALLITTITLHRCLFATSCCGLLWAMETDDAQKNNPPRGTNGQTRGQHSFIEVGPLIIPLERKDCEDKSMRREWRSAPCSGLYQVFVVFALVAWILQTWSVAILLADVFAVPLAHSMSRSIAGGWQELAMVIFMAITATGLPQLMRTLEYVAEEPIVHNGDRNTDE